ncbi:AI-2E family transporter [Suicoccus acidiformans]|uniref:AI-2E family transporter n=1 Tax=Suicoccus acidiformans TaxID=2036206 RepID=A0A347WLN7_9LACT|nr:AI-2E family transporter [Suicoccus acidiformans]AXY25994.1 AI-2E family transporter [Suicoccus acidiformans]
MNNLQRPDQEEKTASLFERTLNNRFVISLLVLLLVMTVVYAFLNVSHLLDPLWIFIELIAFPVIAAGIFYYILDPLVSFLERKGIERNFAIWIIFIIAIMLIVWGVYSLIPMLTEQAQSFIQNLPRYNAQVQGLLAQLPIQTNGPTESELSLNSQIQAVLNSLHLGELSERIRDFLPGTIDGIGNVIGTVFTFITGILTMPIILYYLLLENKRIAHNILYLVPDKYTDVVGRILRNSNLQVSRYIGGQVLVAIAVGFMFGMGYSIIELDYAVLLAAISGVANIIPYIGSILAAIPALIIGLLTSPAMFLKVCIVIAIEQFIEGRFVSPQILGSNMNIHPVTILFILLGAGRLFGVSGVILGVPAYAVIKVIVVEMYQYFRKSSGLYEDIEVVNEGEFQQQKADLVTKLDEEEPGQNE